MRLCIRVWNSDVPCQRFAFGPREQGSAVRAFIVLPHQADWLLDCGDLCSFDGSPDNVVEMNVSLLSGSTLTARQSMHVLVHPQVCHRRRHVVRKPYSLAYVRQRP